MASSSRAYFEQQRESLIGEIAMGAGPPHTRTQSFEHVLANINKLNRNLEAVIAVGNEFSSVEALWSTFENVMGKEEGEGKDDENNDSGGNNHNNTEAEGAQAKVEDGHDDHDHDEEEEEEEHRAVDGDGDVEMG